MPEHTDGAVPSGVVDLGKPTQFPTLPKPETSIQPSKVGGACRPNPYCFTLAISPCRCLIVYSSFLRARRAVGLAAGFGASQRTRREKLVMVPLLLSHCRYDVSGWTLCLFVCLFIYLFVLKGISEDILYIMKHSGKY